MRISLKLFGGFSVRSASGKEFNLRTRKIRALLAYLAVNADKPQPRERLMALLWSNRGERQARQSLNQALVSLRRLGAEEGVQPLDSNNEQVTLLGDAISSDVEQLRSLAANDPVSAAKLYDGPFLDGISVPEPAFEEWLRATRSALHLLACSALEHAAVRAEEEGEAEQALGHMRHLVALDPLREEAHRRLMMLLRRSGDRTGALRQYQVCKDILQRELQTEPDATTKQLFEQMRQDSGNLRDLKFLSGLSETPQTLPGKPSIAVLPFDNLSQNPIHESFADGITEDIITGLCRFRSLFVIARSSTFSYKDKFPDIRRVARELGVRYILEGSLRQSGKRIRISGKLIEAETGNHLWAESYDRELEDIFAVQDDVTNAIVSAIAPEIDTEERRRAQRTHPASLSAWDLYQRGLISLNNATVDSFASAIRIFDKVTELDPQFAPGFAMATVARIRFINNAQPENRVILIEEGRKLAQNAMDLDPSDPLSYHATGLVHFHLGETERGIAELKEAIALNPNYAAGHFALGNLLRNSGDAEQAISHLDSAMQLNPRDPRLSAWQQMRAMALFDLERYQEAEVWARRATLSPRPQIFAYVVLIATLIQLNRWDEAASFRKNLYAIKRDFSLDFVRKATAYHRNRESCIARMILALRTAGVLEHANREAQ